MEEIFAWFALAFFGFLSYRFIAANGCPSCGSPWFFLNPEKDASMECSIAFHVCRSCGHRKEKGTVGCDGKVSWDDGSRGYIDYQGKYCDLVDPHRIS